MKSFLFFWLTKVSNSFTVAGYTLIVRIVIKTISSYEIRQGTYGTIPLLLDRLTLTNNAHNLQQHFASTNFHFIINYIAIASNAYFCRRRAEKNGIENFAR